jgi:hypothetical protein
VKLLQADSSRSGSGRVSHRVGTRVGSPGGQMESPLLPLPTEQLLGEDAGR